MNLKTEYRIMEHAGRFHPQYKTWKSLGWHTAWHEDFDCGGWEVTFSTLAGAQAVIDKWKAADLPPVIHSSP